MPMQIELFFDTIFYVIGSEIVANSELLYGAEVISDKRVAVIGYGNQGRAHALNLRESGISVVVGGRIGSISCAQALADGFQAHDHLQAVRDADLVSISLPDEVHGAVCPT